MFKGDNTAAFDNDFITIELENPNNIDITVSKAVFICGKSTAGAGSGGGIAGTIVKTFNNPEFPLVVNLDETETAKLDYCNDCYLIIYDSEGRKHTCEGVLTFYAERGVI